MPSKRIVLPNKSHALSSDCSDSLRTEWPISCGQYGRQVAGKSEASMSSIGLSQAVFHWKTIHRDELQTELDALRIDAMASCNRTSHLLKRPVLRASAGTSAVAIFSLSLSHPSSCLLKPPTSSRECVAWMSRTVMTEGFFPARYVVAPQWSSCTIGDCLPASLKCVASESAPIQSTAW